MNIRKEFMELEDCRHQSHIDYNLSNVCTVMMSAALCGIDMLEKILVYAQGEIRFFQGKVWDRKDSI